MKRILVATMAGLITINGLAAEKTPALVLEPLPYAYDALEPHIDALTMEIHYSRHHQAYFNNIVKAVAGTDLEGQSIDAILAVTSKQSDTVRNNAGGHYNHTLFWQIMSPNGGGEPTGALAEAINGAFGSLDKFKAEFKQAAMSRFGSGWAWLCVDSDGKLFVTSSANQDNPLMDNFEKRGYPIIGFDVWEHAYYLKYQNMRGSYIDAFWHVINWDEIARRFASVKL